MSSLTDTPRRPSREKNERSSAAMDELRRRLSRIGINTGQNFTPRPRQAARPLEDLVQGIITDTEHGPSFRITRIYPSDTLHGTGHLGAWLTQTSESLARVGGDHAIG